jgi:LuxR family maltose regulon positive regulatory protein
MSFGQLHDRRASSQIILVDSSASPDVAIPIRPGLRTRVIRPRLPSDHVVRSRLIDLLDRSLARQLTVVSAPAGFGKTTLLSAWSPPGYLITWLSLDEDDSNLRCFAQGLVHTIRSVTPDAAGITLGLLQVTDLPSPAILASRLANELADVPEGLVIVLDDYHTIDDDEVHTFIGYLVEWTPANAHLVIATRHDPPLALPMHGDRPLLTRIGLAELIFTADEMNSFFDAALPSGTDGEVAGRIAARTEGWAAGLRLGAIAMSAGANSAVAPIDLETRGAQFAHELLIEDVLATQPPDLQELLLRSAILDRFCAPLLDMLLADPNVAFRCEDFLAAARQANLFITALGPDDIWYRFHQLFREALHGLLLARSSPDLVATLHRRASAWFANQGMIEEAIRHALAAGEPERAARLIEEDLHPLLDREDDPGRLEAWIRLIPPDLANHDPALLLARAWLARLRNRMNELPELLRACESSLDKDTLRDDVAREALRGSAATLWAYAWSVSFDGERMLANTESAIQRVPRRWRIARGHAEFMHASTLDVLGRDQEARQFIAACRAGATPADGPRLALVLSAEARMHWLSFNIRDLACTANEILSFAEADRRPFAMVAGRLFAGLASYERNTLDEARDHFRLGTSAPFGIALILYVENVLGLALSLHALGSYDQARDELRRITVLAEDVGSLGGLYLLRSCQARLALARGDDDEAGRQLRLLRDCESSALPSFVEVPEITQAKWLLHQGTQESLHEASNVAAQLRRTAGVRRSVLSHVRAESVQALLLQARGDTEGALAVLNDVVALTRQHEVIRLLVDFGTPMQQLLAEMLRLASHSDPYLARVLAAFPETTEPLMAMAPSRQATESPAVEALSRRELEILDLLSAHLSNKEISRSLGISLETVKKHTISVYRKLRVGGRREAVARGHALGLLPVASQAGTP